MEDLSKRVILKTIKCLNVILMTIPFLLFWNYSYSLKGMTSFQKNVLEIIVLLYFFFYILCGKVYEGFQISTYRISEMIYSQSLAAALSDAILYLVLILTVGEFINPILLFIALLIQILISAVWSFLAHKWYFSVFPPKKSAIIYDQRNDLNKLIQEYGLSKKFQVQKSLYIEDCLCDLNTLEGMQVIFLSGVHSHDRNIVLKYCILHGIKVYLIPRVGDVLMSGAKQVHLFHLPIMRVERYNPPLTYLFVKRTFDIVASCAALVILSPILIITAIAIKLTDGGPIFYKQKRLTKNGKEFDILKFRSMRVDAEKDGIARLSTGDKDERVTKVGRIIRAVRIDELPQLLCILNGTMSIVGPRPERPEIVARYEKEVPEFQLRLQAKAGLTGYAQVYGKYNTTPYDKLQMDLIYIAHPSIIEDLRIIFATVKILFIPESTEGITQGQTTAIIEEEQRAIEGLK